jgi:hypothetical protein
MLVIYKDYTEMHGQQNIKFIIKVSLNKIKTNKTHFYLFLISVS